MQKQLETAWQRSSKPMKLHPNELTKLEDANRLRDIGKLNQPNY